MGRAQGQRVAVHLGLISLERWDDVWRRNQHLASQLIEQGIVERITFVEPAGWGQRRQVIRRRASRRSGHGSDCPGARVGYA